MRAPHRVLFDIDGSLRLLGVDGENYPVVVDERAPRDAVGAYALTPHTGIHMHPLMIIELAAGDDLVGRSKAALLWIQERVADQAAAAVQRIELMHRPELRVVERFARHVDELIARRMQEDRRQTRLWAEENYRFPATREAVQ